MIYNLGILFSWLSFSVFCKEKKDEILLSVAQEIENVIYD